MTESVIVDGNGKFVGSMPMREAHDKGVYCAISTGIIKDLDCNIWLQVRGPKVASKGLLDFSAAGHIDKGETVQEAFKRELKEETGLEIEVTTEPLHFPSSFERRGRIVKHYHFVFFIKTDKIPTADGLEVAGFIKMSKKDLVEKVNKTPKEFTKPFTEFIIRFNERL